MISIRMLKLCGKTTCRHLKIIFKTHLNTYKFSIKYKKGNVVPINEIDDKRNVKNNRSVSLLE